MITCRFENAREGALRHVAVDGIVLNPAGQALLVRRRPDLVEGGKWSMPGGFVDRDETIFTATRREIHEETGYEVSTIDLFAVISDPNRNDNDRQNISFVFTARVGEQTAQPDDESVDQQWFDLDALPGSDAMAFDHLRLLEMYGEHRLARNPGPVVY